MTKMNWARVGWQKKMARPFIYSYPFEDTDTATSNRSPSASTTPAATPLPVPNDYRSDIHRFRAVSDDRFKCMCGFTCAASNPVVAEKMHHSKWVRLSRSERAEADRRASDTLANIRQLEQRLSEELAQVQRLKKKERAAQERARERIANDPSLYADTLMSAVSRGQLRTWDAIMIRILRDVVWGDAFPKGFSQGGVHLSDVLRVVREIEDRHADLGPRPKDIVKWVGSTIWENEDLRYLALHRFEASPEDRTSGNLGRYRVITRKRLRKIRLRTAQVDEAKGRRAT